MLTIPELRNRDRKALGVMSEHSGYSHISGLRIP
jgi:hypothetical protein